MTRRSRRNSEPRVDPPPTPPPDDVKSRQETIAEATANLRLRAAKARVEVATKLARTIDLLKGRG